MRLVWHGLFSPLPPIRGPAPSFPLLLAGRVVYGLGPGRSLLLAIPLQQIDGGILPHFFKIVVFEMKKFKKIGGKEMTIP